MGPGYVEFLAAQGPDLLNARVETFTQYGTAFVRQIQNQTASAIPTRFVAMSDEEAKPCPLRVDVKHFFGKEGETASCGSVKLRWP